MDELVNSDQIPNRRERRSFITLNASSAFLQSGGAEKAAYETLKLIDTLFANDSMPTSWNNLEDFQDIIYRQIEESECVSQTASHYKDNSICYNSIFLNLILLSRLNQIMSKTQSSEDSPARNATLKMYFDKIATVLKEKVRKWRPQQCSLCSFGHIEFVLITIMSLSRNPVIVRGRWFERRYYTHSNLFSRAPTTLFSQEAM